MKPQSLFIASKERHAGSLLVSLGLMAMIRQRYERIAFFRPIVEKMDDPDFNFINDTFQLALDKPEMVGVCIDDLVKAVSEDNTHALYEKLIHQYQNLLAKYDFVLVQGMQWTHHASGIEQDINLDLAKNFNAPYVTVLNGQDKSSQEIKQEIDIEVHASKEVDLFAIFVNRVHEKIVENKYKHPNISVFYLPENDTLNQPTMEEIASALGAEKLTENNTVWNRLVKAPIVAAMTPEHFLPRMQDNDLVIVPGDRTDILLAAAMSMSDRNIPKISGLMLTGGLKPEPIIQQLVFQDQGEQSLPVLSVSSDTYETAMRASKVRAQLQASNAQKTNRALGLFDAWVDRECLMNKLQQQSLHPDIMTPIMFEFSLFEKARSSLQTIVLPESEDERVLAACETLLSRQVVKPILLGKRQDIEHKASLLGLHIEDVEIIDPETSSLKEVFAQDFYEMRKHKGMTLDAARDAMSDVSYFATMMVQKGLADGMVSGATHTTADTIRPALQIIKTQPGTSLVSSVFFMCFSTRVLVYGDCAVNQHPSDRQLAEIAMSSAATAKMFGIEPKVALLSYSTGKSGQGNEVEKVHSAAEIAHQLQPELLLEGPLQYDAAIDATVAAQKMPNSQVAGQATVFVFPDLNTGNNTYKAVQRASGAIAIGPVLQGLNKPINDLSRGCSVADIVNTVAITAIQAQQI